MIAISGLIHDVLSGPLVPLAVGCSLDESHRTLLDDEDKRNCVQHQSKIKKHRALGDLLEDRIYSSSGLHQCIRNLSAAVWQ